MLLLANYIFIRRDTNPLFYLLLDFEYWTYMTHQSTQYQYPIIITNMSYKVVQNYQLSQQNHYIEDGIQVYIANHNTSKLPYLLKKVNTNHTDKLKYKSLLNQIGILKLLSSSMVVECHKMLKTSNNVYLVYDYCDGSPLSEIMKTFTKQTKISIVLQILEFFKLMANASVVHCNLKPSSIIVSTDKKIKVINFTYGVNRSKSKSAQIQFKPSPSPYVAPEILKEGIVHEKTDFYSLGVILSEIGIVQKGTYLEVGSSSNIKYLPKIIELLMSENPNQRPDIEEVQKIFKGQTIKTTPRKKSYEISEKQVSPSTSLKKTKSVSSNQEVSKKLILSPISVNSDSPKVNERKFVQLILKRRNFAIFLLQMSETCLKLQQDQKKYGLFLSYIFMKKSCTIICNLLGFLKGEKNCQNQIDNKILEKSERAAFEKKPDFFKILTTIQKQAGNQKRWLEDIFHNIGPELPLKLKQTATEEEINDRILISYIKQYLTDLISKQKMSEHTDKKVLQNFYLMSQIICHKSYEKLFEEMISQQKRSLNEQQLYIHVRQMDSKNLLAQIGGRLKIK